MPWSHSKWKQATKSLQKEISRKQFYCLWSRYPEWRILTIHSEHWGHLFIKSYLGIEAKWNIPCLFIFCLFVFYHSLNSWIFLSMNFAFMLLSWKHSDSNKVVVIYGCSKWPHTVWDSNALRSLQMICPSHIRIILRPVAKRESFYNKCGEIHAFLIVN